MGEECEGGRKGSGEEEYGVDGGKEGRELVGEMGSGGEQLGCQGKWSERGMVRRGGGGGGVWGRGEDM